MIVGRFKLTAVLTDKFICGAVELDPPGLPKGRLAWLDVLYFVYVLGISREHERTSARG